MNSLISGVMTAMSNPFMIAMDNVFLLFPEYRFRARLARMFAVSNLTFAQLSSGSYLLGDAAPRPRTSHTPVTHPTPIDRSILAGSSRNL